ncbi:NAD+ synthase [Georgenia sp. TF02-10]|uniref:NAD+ synthase n=1 Tax=Georgenia sp. TF02-10 TaxID=2917725 RepID=UPI001FA71952|nr:NAD+ synthase [Georgenia sp. TF02-10]UNX53454.1 NAD+ synthase [Georgenia sp. TF02-10]
MKIRIALGQLNPRVGDLDGNAEIVRGAVAAAVARGADVVLLPEMVLTGYPVEDLALRGSFRDAAAERLERLAGELAADGHGAAHVVLGCLGTAADGRPTNVAAHVTGGAVADVYTKHHLPNYGVFDEHRIFAPGTGAVVLEVGGQRLGVVICEDIWVDGGPLAELAGQGLDALLVLNGSPYEHGKGKVRQRLAADRAAELGCPVAYVNMVGGQDDLVFDGHSFVLDADGALVAAARGFGTDLLVLDLPGGGAPPRALPAEGAAAGESASDRPELGAPAFADRAAAADAAPGTAPRLPGAGLPADADDTGQMYHAITLGLADYVRKNGFTSVVLGLSGGIDSALVAAVAADALGGDRVIGVSLPSAYSSTHSRDDAADLADRLGLDYRVQPIAPMVDAFTGQLALTGLAEENLQARLRAVVLMAISNSEGPLLLATGNKSELAVGYSTIYGDAAGGFAPLKDVLKTKVWELARWRNAVAEAAGERPPIPPSSIEKPPSAELRPGQQDSDSLPEYHLLDGVLAGYVDRSMGRAELLAAGFDAETVERVVTLVDRAEWKRRQYPLGPKVTAVAFGRDRRLPVTNGWREQPAAEVPVNAEPAREPAG